MPLTNMTDMLAHAYRHGYALGAFAVNDLDTLCGVITAAEASRAPVLLAPKAPVQNRMELLLPAVEAAAHRAGVPIAIQLEVAADPEATARAIKLGCNGLRFVPTEDSFLRSAQQTQAAAATARACGLATEAAPKADTVGTAAEARGFVDRSGIEALRVDLHGEQHRGNGNRKTRVDYSRLKQVNQALGLPLSVDPGNDLSEDQYHRLIRNGVAAIGYRLSALEGTDAGASAGPGQGAATAVADAVATEAEHRMRMWGAAGRAAEVLAQCAPWGGAEQVVVCNTPGGAPDGEMETALARGEDLLGRIPGVREAVGLTTAAEDAPYRYAWRVRLCHPTALASFQDHANRTAFADGGVHFDGQGCTGISYHRIAGTGGPAPGHTEPPPATDPLSTASKVTTLDHGNKRNLA